MMMNTHLSDLSGNLYIKLLNKCNILFACLNSNHILFDTKGPNKGL